jgi:hypothetical protein
MHDTHLHGLLAHQDRLVLQPIHGQTAQWQNAFLWHNRRFGRCRHQSNPRLEDGGPRVRAHIVGAVHEQIQQRVSCF